MIKAVFFDLGNTLVDWSIFYSKEADNLDLKILNSLGYRFSQRKFRKYLIKTEKFLETEFKENPRKRKPGFFYYYLYNKFLGIKITREEAEEIEKYVRRKLLSKVKLIPHSLRVLNWLKKKRFKIALINNGHRRKTNEILRMFNLRKFFDVIIISDEVGREKCTGIPFKVALKKLKLAPSDVIAVNDRLDEDVVGAKKVGIITVKFNFGYWKNKYYGKKIQPDFTINSLNELIPLIKSLKI
jgi:FMN phosphatase YigB (HAD superfamily)